MSSASSLYVPWSNHMSPPRQPYILQSQRISLVDSSPCNKHSNLHSLSKVGESAQSQLSKRIASIFVSDITVHEHVVTVHPTVVGAMADRPMKRAKSSHFDSNIPPLPAKQIPWTNVSTDLMFSYRSLTVTRSSRTTSPSSKDTNECWNCSSDTR